MYKTQLQLILQKQNIFLAIFAYAGHFDLPEDQKFT